MLNHFLYLQPTSFSRFQSVFVSVSPVLFVNHKKNRYFIYLSILFAGVFDRPVARICIKYACRCENNFFLLKNCCHINFGTVWAKAAI